MSQAKLTKALQPSEILVITALIVSILATGSTHADQPLASESEIKGAYLLNFTRLVTWPDSGFTDPEEHLIIGILDDDDPFQILVDALESGREMPRPVSVRDIDSFEQISACHMLYISQKSKQSMAEILARTSGRPILTVSDMSIGKPNA